jgi:hypothetical protein
VGGVPNAHSAPITPARRATAAPPVNKQEKAVAAAIDDALAANAVAHSDAKPLEHVTKGRPRPSRTSRPTRATVSKIETRTETDESDDAQRAARQRVATMMGPSTSLATADDEPAPPPPQILSRASMREEHPPPPATLSRASVREEQPPPPATLARASSREPDPPAPPAPESDDPPPPESDDPPPPPPGGTDSPLLPRQPSRGPQRRGPAPGVGIARSPVAARPLSSSANAAVRGPSRAPPQDAATSRGPARATPLSASSSAVPVHAVGRGAAPPPRTSFRGPPPGTPTRAAAAPVANEPAPPEPAPPVHVDSDDEDGAPPPPSAPAAPEHDDHDVDVAPPPQPDDSDDDGDANVHTRPPPSDDPPPPTPPAPTAAAIAAAVAGPPVASPSPPVGPASPAVARRSAGSAVQRPTIVSSPPVQHRGTPPQNGSPANSPLVRQASSPDARRLSQQTAPVTLNRGQSMMSSSGHLHPAAATAAAVLAASANDSPSGWLEKKGLKRFFVLRQKTLYWFKDKVDPNGTVPELAKQSQKSLILTNSRKISKTPKKPGVLIASEKEKSYELFADHARGGRSLVRAARARAGAADGRDWRRHRDQGRVAARLAGGAAQSVARADPATATTATAATNGQVAIARPGAARGAGWSRFADDCTWAQSSATVGARCREAGAGGCRCWCWWQQHDV